MDGQSLVCMPHPMIIKRRPNIFSTFNTQKKKAALDATRETTTAVTQSFCNLANENFILDFNGLKKQLSHSPVWLWHKNFGLDPPNAADHFINEHFLAVWQEEKFFQHI